MKQTKTCPSSIFQLPFPCWIAKAPWNISSSTFAKMWQIKGREQRKTLLYLLAYKTKANATWYMSKLMKKAIKNIYSLKQVYWKEEKSQHLYCCWYLSLSIKTQFPQRRCVLLENFHWVNNKNVQRFLFSFPFLFSPFL